MLCPLPAVPSREVELHPLSSGAAFLPVEFKRPVGLTSVVWHSWGSAHRALSALPGPGQPSGLWSPSQSERGSVISPGWVHLLQCRWWGFTLTHPPAVPTALGRASQRASLPPGLPLQPSHCPSREFFLKHSPYPAPRPSGTSQPQHEFQGPGGSWKCSVTWL